MNHNYLYHITKKQYLDSVIKKGLQIDKGISGSYIYLAASVNDCLALAPIATSYWYSKSYYDKLKNSMLGKWYFWKTIRYEVPVLRVDISGIENHLLCSPNRDYKEFILNGHVNYIPEYKCDCDISPDRVEFCKQIILDLDMMDTRKREKPDDWETGKTIIKSKGFRVYD